MYWLSLNTTNGIRYSSFGLPVIVTILLYIVFKNKNVSLKSPSMVPAIGTECLLRPRANAIHMIECWELDLGFRVQN